MRDDIGVGAARKLRGGLALGGVEYARLGVEARVSEGEIKPRRKLKRGTEGS